VVGVIAWIGGLLTVAVLNARFSRREERSARAAIVRQTPSAAAFRIVPGDVMALLTGIAMTSVGNTGVPLWIAWGVAAIGRSLRLGGTLLRRWGNELASRLANGAGDVQALERRLATWNAVNIALLLSAVWAMVFKPTL